jgi:hypothetical protein
MSFVKAEANSILIVDSNAVLPFAVAVQTLQAVTRRDEQVGNGLRGVERSQSTQGYGCDVGELFDALTAEKAFRLLASEAPDHDPDGIVLYVVRQAY